MHVDSRRLKQILVNLLVNAVKFTPEGGDIGLKVEGDEERRVARFTVWDTGIGIAPQDQSRLFQSFSQIDGALTRQYAGTGLGLALVRNMVDLHGGTVSVTSTGVPGEGSAFIVSLPWAGEKLARAPQQAGPRSGTGPLSSPNGLEAAAPLILLADDNAASISTLSEFFTGVCGYRVVTAQNGVEALRLAREQRPALILMDIQMPEMDGLEAIRRIRATPELASIPIIAATALAMPEDRERCLKAGANDYMSKPVNLKRLAIAIRDLLDPKEPNAGTDGP